MGDAAVDQQRRMQETLVGFANHISSTAIDLNATWPLFRIPSFELHAGQARLQSGVEYLGCSYLVESKDATEYLAFVTTHYKDTVAEGHLMRYGNLDRLAPTGYTPNFTITGPTGPVPDIVDRPIRLPVWQVSPRTFIQFNSSINRGFCL